MRLDPDIQGENWMSIPEIIEEIYGACKSNIKSKVSGLREYIQYQKRVERPAGGEDGQGLPPLPEV